MRHALLITNLAARTVSPRVKQVIVKAISADLKLEVADTQARNHATELAQEAADRGLDLVIAFGGDGTMNEVVNGIAGTETALAVLPGGMANVLCRTLGIPVDIVEATGYLLNRAKTGKTRRINIGRMDDRYFVMSCGIGLDAATVKRVEANPALKRRYRDWYFLAAAFRSAFAEYKGRVPYIRIVAGDMAEDVVLAVISKTPRLTYFKGIPVTVAPKTKLDGGFDVLAMRKFPVSYIPGLMLSVLKTGSHMGHKQVRYAHDVDTVHLVSTGQPFPVQVDGEFVGDRSEVKAEVVDGGLSILD